MDHGTKNKISKKVEKQKGNVFFQESKAFCGKKYNTTIGKRTVIPEIKDNLKYKKTPVRISICLS